MIGQTLSHYRITAALGAGGMGEVYRAKDTSLGRDVAIKVLPAEVAGDPERLARFRREATLLAALNHPHIAAIHGLEEHDGSPFLVLELVEGEDLAERLRRGPIPVEETLEIACQIAEALERAHEKGIIHRDLKPANVKVTPEGEVKILDFGLAKAWEGETLPGSSGDLSQSPTLAHSGTQAGVILGTAAYMSPEQARAQPVDRRTDVWAFGVLLWEMLTGRTLFAGDTVTDVIAAVVKEEPDLDALPAATPRAVRRLIARCLRKDRRTRLPDIGGARLDLQEVLAGTVDEGPSGRRAADEDGAAAFFGLSPKTWAWAAAWLVTAGVAAYFALAPRSDTVARPPAAHFVVDPPEGWSFFASGWPLPSPDGRHVLMFARRDTGRSGWSPWLRSLGFPTPRRLTEMEPHDLGRMFWSPDSRFVGFFAGGELRKFSVADGVVQTICTLPPGFPDRATWGVDGTIVFESGARLFAVPAAGGEAKLALEPDTARGEVALMLPQLLPHGRRLLYAALGIEGPLGTFVASLDEPSDRRLLLADGVRCEPVGNHLVFNRGGTLLAQAFDPVRGELAGEAEPIASSVATVGQLNAGAFGVSPEGTLAYLSGENNLRAQLAWVDRKGALIETLGQPERYDQIALSPDDRRVAVEIADASRGTFDLWVIDVARGVPSRLTSDAGNERDPVWSPDGRELIYKRVAGGESRLYRTGLDGEEGSLVPHSSDEKGSVIAESWSRDGKTLVYKTFDGTKAWALSLEGEAQAEVVLDLGFSLDEPQISPDGRWLAYHSEESGPDDWEVYIQPFRRAGEKVRVSTEGGVQPKWRSDSQELFYLTPRGQMMAVDVTAGEDGPEVSGPTPLFGLERTTLHRDDYGVSADGQRFLVKQPAGAEQKRQMHVVLNWQSLLEQAGE